MRKTQLLLVMALVLGSVGCGSETPKVDVTPEMEVEQKQAESDIRNAEAANRKNQKRELTREEGVEAAEHSRRRR